MRRTARLARGTNQYGVLRGDVRKLAAKIKNDHELAIQLWATGNIDAQFLAILLIKPKDLSRDEVDGMMRSIDFTQVADWFISYIVSKHPTKRPCAKGGWPTAIPGPPRAGWALTAERISKKKPGRHRSAGLLNRIESDMKEAAPEVQWTMNNSLAGIGIHFPIIASVPSPSAKPWASIGTILCPKAAPPPFAPFGSTKW